MVYVNDDIQTLDLTASLNIVGPERREYALHYRCEADRRLCVAAYLLLQRALRLEFGMEQVPRFAYGPHGKPYFEDYPDIHFNLSHCQDVAACVVATHPVGIDVESIDRYDWELLPYTMNDDEQRLIVNSPHPEVDFVRLWTMKESLLKLTGQGIADDIKSILVTPSACRFHTTIHPRYIYTVCCPV